MQPVTRLSYEDSCRILQKQGFLAAAAIPPLLDRAPQPDDTVLGVSFFRIMIQDAKLERLTLPRTFIGRTEFRASSFGGTDLSESTANWNDFIEVNFRGADLSRADFRACLFEQVKFTDALLADVDFRYCGFKQCDFAGADLTNARLTRKTGASLKLTPEQQSVIDWQAEDGVEPGGG